MISSAFAHEVSEDRYYYRNTDDGSWLCTCNDINDITAEIDPQHHNRQPISPAACPPQPDCGKNASDAHRNHQHNGPRTDTTKSRARVGVEVPNRLKQAAARK